MSLRSLQRMKSEDLVMPAWIAGTHQVRKDASGDIRVDWIPALHAGMTQSERLCSMIEVPPALFS
jgi:hypothetical protein